MKTKISVVFLIFSLFLTTAPFSFAQNSQNDWSVVQKLATGTDLLIKTSKGKTLNGSLVTVNNDEVKLSIKGNSFALPKNNIEAIYLAAPKSKKRGRHIGSVIGALAGALAGGAAINRDAILESEYNYAAPLLITVAGGVGGYFIGGLFGKGKKKGALIYKAK